MNQYKMKLDEWCAKVGAKRRGYSIDLPPGLWVRCWDDEEISSGLWGHSHKHLWEVVTTSRFVRETELT